MFSAFLLLFYCVSVFNVPIFSSLPHLILPQLVIFYISYYFLEFRQKSVAYTYGWETLLVSILHFVLLKLLLL